MLLNNNKEQPGRNIIDGLLIVNEIITWAKQTRKRIFLLKVDFDKAFDKLNRNFLLCTLEQMGFGKKSIEWIKGLIS